MTDTQNCCDRRERATQHGTRSPTFYYTRHYTKSTNGRAMIARPQALDKMPQNNNIRIMPAQSAPSTRLNSNSTHMGKSLPTSHSSGACRQVPRKGRVASPRQSCPAPASQKAGRCSRRGRHHKCRTCTLNDCCGFPHIRTYLFMYGQR